MNGDVKTRWLAALRSGDYTQERNILRRQLDTGGTGYCCLGVLCDISGQGEWNGSTFEAFDDYRADTLPLPIVTWAGLDSSDPEINGTRISQLNDEERLTFAELADLIEKEL